MNNLSSSEIDCKELDERDLSKTQDEFSSEKLYGHMDHFDWNEIDDADPDETALTIYA